MSRDLSPVMTASPSCDSAGDPRDAPAAPNTFSKERLSTLVLKIRPSRVIPLRGVIREAGRSPV